MKKKNHNHKVDAGCVFFSTSTMCSHDINTSTNQKSNIMCASNEYGHVYCCCSRKNIAPGITGGKEKDEERKKLTRRAEYRDFCNFSTEWHWSSNWFTRFIIVVPSKNKGATDRWMDGWEKILWFCIDQTS